LGVSVLKLEISTGEQSSVRLADETRRQAASKQGETSLALGPDGKELYVTVVKDPNDPQAKGSVVKVPNVE
jgi:hypothetical protein